MYKDSAWLFIGGLNYELNEGDVITVFSQYGEVVNANLVRDKVSGKSKGFAFLCYEDQRSTNLAVDNLNGITLVGRIIRVDHVEQYKVPKMDAEMDEEQKKLLEEGCAPTPMALGGTVKPKSEIKKEIKEEKDRTQYSSRRKLENSREEHRNKESRRHRSRSRERERERERQRERRGSPVHRRRSASRERTNRVSPSHEKSHHHSSRSRHHGERSHERRKDSSISRERSRIK